MSSYNPIRRTRMKPKAKEHKENAPWRPQRIRLNADEMRRLRWQVLERSGLSCENKIDGQRCEASIGWYDMQMHHIIHRSQGGSDTLDNLLGICADCHLSHHDKNAPIQPHWID